MQPIAASGRRSTARAALLLATAVLAPLSSAQETWSLVGNHIYGSNLEGMVYDSGPGETLAFYGGNFEVWAWDGSTWTLRGSKTWSWYGYATTGYKVAYDPMRNVTVLFGGTDLAGPSDRVYEWNGTSWSDALTPLTTTPPARGSGHTMAYAGGGKVLMSGGTVGGNPAYDAWLWDGTDWQQAADMLGTVVGGTAVYDGQRVVQFGGSDGFGGILGSTRAFDGANWSFIGGATIPPADVYPGMVYDTTRNRIVLFDAGETWAFDGTDWQQLGPNVSPDYRSGHGMAYDPVRDRVIMHSGYRPLVGQGSTDTWELLDPDLGFQGPGSATARLTGVGLNAGESMDYEVVGAEPNAAGALLLSMPHRANATLFPVANPGTLVSGEGVLAVLPVVADASGTLLITVPGVGSAADLVFQTLFVDASVLPHQVAFSNGMLAQFGQ